MSRSSVLGHLFLAFVLLAAITLPVRAQTTTLNVSPSQCPMNAVLTISGTTSPNTNVLVTIMGTTFVDTVQSDGGGNWQTSTIWTWSQGFYTVTAQPMPAGAQATATVEGGVTIVKAVKTVAVNTAVTTDSLFMTVRTIVTTVTGSASTVTVSGTFTRTMSSGTVTVSTVVQSTAIVTEVSTTLSTSTSTSTASATMVTTPHTTLTRLSTSTIVTTTRVAPPTPLAIYGVAIIAVVAVVLLHVWFLVLRKRRRPR